MGENLYGKIGPGWVVPGLSFDEPAVEAAVEAPPPPPPPPPVVVKPPPLPPAPKPAPFIPPIVETDE